MARAACKIIIDSGLIALQTSLFRILTEPNLHGGKLPDEVRIRLLQDMANLDIASYRTDKGAPPAPSTCLRNVMLELQTLGILSEDVWAIYA